MKRFSAELLFLFFFSGLLWILSREIPIHKVEFMGIDLNPGYKWTAIVIFFLFIVFNQFVLNQKFLINIVYSILVGSFLFLVACLLNYFLIEFMTELDNQVTPLGWQFKYKWLDLLFFAILSIISTEMISKRIKNKSKC
ncbi:MAG: hypothetical protein AAFN93_25205 [Bacteroidota bacterium]